MIQLKPPGGRVGRVISHIDIGGINVLSLVPSVGVLTWLHRILVLLLLLLLFHSLPLPLTLSLEANVRWAIYCWISIWGVCCWCVAGQHQCQGIAAGPARVAGDDDVATRPHLLHATRSPTDALYPHYPDLQQLRDSCCGCCCCWRWCSWWRL